MNKVHEIRVMNSIIEALDKGAQKMAENYEHQEHRVKIANGSPAGQGKKLLYVAGKYGDSRGAGCVEANIRIAEEIAQELWRIGFAVICPHTNTRHFDGLVPKEHFLAGDLVMVERCDGIVMVPNWLQSDGAQAEYRHALANRLPVFFWQFPDDRLVLRAWASGSVQVETVLRSA